ncbi:MAG: hypothetical protein R6U00_08135 [Prochlorococcaceae cyanobacterium]
MVVAFVGCMGGWQVCLPGDATTRSQATDPLSRSQHGNNRTATVLLNPLYPFCPLSTAKLSAGSGLIAGHGR